MVSACSLYVQKLDCFPSVLILQLSDSQLLYLPILSEKFVLALLDRHMTLF